VYVACPGQGDGIVGPDFGRRIDQPCNFALIETTLPIVDLGKEVAGRRQSIG
jgi:hypothetical protein